MLRLLRDLHEHVHKPRLFASGRIPSRRTPSGVTLRLVVNEAALKITRVHPPTGGQAA